jgi:nicotinate-nucleotide adenylyltransferase
MSDIEHTEKLDGYTISLHDALTTKYPTYNFYYVIGKDIANSIEKYKFYDKLIKDCQFIVCDRPGYESNGNTWYLKGKHIYLEDVENLIQASSTELREKILNGNIEELKEKISIDVLNYIIEHKLYSNEK